MYDLFLRRRMKGESLSYQISGIIEMSRKEVIYDWEKYYGGAYDEAAFSSWSGTSFPLKLQLIWHTGQKMFLTL